MPEPVGPVTSTKPRGWRVNSCTVGGQAELVDRGQAERDQAEGGADRAALVVGVDTEAGVAGDRVGEVELPVGLQALALVAGEDRVDDLARVGPATAPGSPPAASGARARARSGARRRLRCRSEARRETTSISRSAKSIPIALPIGHGGPVRGAGGQWTKIRVAHVLHELAARSRAAGSDAIGPPSACGRTRAPMTQHGRSQHRGRCRSAR